MTLYMRPKTNFRNIDRLNSYFRYWILGDKMTKVWNNGKHHDSAEKTNHDDTFSETNIDMKEGEWTDKAKHQNGVNVNNEECEDEEVKKKSFFRLCCSENLEKDLAEQSKVMLNMIYFFQILPFYILQFTSGMALGKLFFIS